MTATPRVDSTDTLRRPPRINIMKTQKLIVWLEDKTSMWRTHKPAPPRCNKPASHRGMLRQHAHQKGVLVLKFIESVSAFLSALHKYKYTLIKMRRIKLPIVTHRDMGGGGGLI